MARKRYYWNEAQLDWVPATGTWRDGLARSMIVGGLVVVLALGISVAFDFMRTSPEELALKEENKILQTQVASADERIAAFSEHLDELALRDQTLYRIMLQVNTIPDAVRQVGIGGSQPYEEFNRLSMPTAHLLTHVEEQLGQLERRLNLQAVSTRELLALAEKYEVRNRELPSIMPAKGRLTSPFGMRQHPIYDTRMHHAGVDITIPSGSPVFATADGVIAQVVRKQSGYGIHIIISHPASGYQTLYGHLSEVMPSVQPGHPVKRGQMVALSGNTGLSAAPHLHYEVHRMDGTKLNPYPFLAPQMSASEYQAILDEAAHF